MPTGTVGLFPVKIAATFFGLKIELEEKCLFHIEGRKMQAGSDF